VGVALSSRLRLPVPALSGLTATLVLAMPPLFHLIRDGGDLSLLQASLLFCLPCLPFGLLYGGLCRTVSVDWGRDLGRFTAANTLGSCAGVLLATLVGFEAPLSWGAGALALGLVAVTLAAVPWPRLAGLGPAMLGDIGFGRIGRKDDFAQLAHEQVRPLRARRPGEVVARRQHHQTAVQARHTR
jgi:hypothetical protein